MEKRIVKFFNSRFSFTDSASELLSHKFYLAIFLFLLSFLSLIFDKTNGIKIFLAVIVAAILHFSISEGILKHSFSFLKRVRPYLVYPKEIRPIGRIQKDASFPSSHMASTLAVFTIYFYFYPQYWPALVAFAIFLAFSRIHCGMHYLTDILAGAVFGAIYGIIALNIIV